MSLISDFPKRLAQAEANARFFSEDGKDNAGREAERKVASDLRPRLAGTGWELRQNIRVADPVMRRQREFDFVITAPDRVVVIELKRWSGKVFMRGEEVIQERRGGQGEVNHGDLFGDLLDRVELLRHRHLAMQGDPVRIERLVVFYDESGNLKLSEEISRRADVVDYARMIRDMPDARKFIGPKSDSFLTRVMNGILSMLGQRADATEVDGPRPPVSSRAILSFRRTIAEFGTWDVIELYGGKIYHGDVLDETGSCHSALHAGLFNRAATARIEIKCERSPINVLFGVHDGRATAKAVGRNGSAGDWRIAADLPIIIQAAGQPTAESFIAGNVVSIEFGYDRKPKTRLSFENLEVGDLLTGKVKFFGPRGAFVDVGLEPREGKRRDVLARPGGPGNKNLTVEQAEAWRGVRVGARVLVRIKSVDLGARRAEVDIVEAA